VGETEILGQVRSAWELARTEQATGTQLNGLFRHALEVGKRARTDTAIARHIASVSTAAVAMAKERLGTLAGQRILVLGAGDMGEGMVRALGAEGAASVRIANRTWERAEELATRVGGEPVRLDALLDQLAEVDLLLTSTGASSLLVEHGELAGVMTGRNGAPLLIVDVAVPRDIDPAAAHLAGVTLLDMDDLRAFADAGMNERRCEVGKVRTIVEDELARFLSVASAREVAPLVGSLHGKAEEVRAAELDRFRARLADLDPRELEAVEALTKGIVAKLLHDPTVRVKDAAGSAKGERLAESLRDLFDL